MDFDSGYRLAIGTVNVAGLANKVEILGDLPPGIWSLTETHLTEAGAGFVKMAAKQMGRAVGRSVRSLYGAPAPSRTVDSSAGTWTGVCVLSDFPCMPVGIDWLDGVFTSGRTLISSHFVGETPVVVGTLYGAAQSPSFRDPLGITQELLRSLTVEVVDKSRGPRCIMGDFNCDLIQFPEMAYWRSQGWQEIQIFAQEVYHKPIEPTCKRVTVRDFVWCSPELLQFFVRAEVNHALFPDHSTVGGFFHFPGIVPVPGLGRFQSPFHGLKSVMMTGFRLFLTIRLPFDGLRTPPKTLAIGALQWNSHWPLLLPIPTENCLRAVEDGDKL